MAWEVPEDQEELWGIRNGHLGEEDSVVRGPSLYNPDTLVLPSLFALSSFSRLPAFPYPSVPLSVTAPNKPAFI